MIRTMKTFAIVIYMLCIFSGASTTVRAQESYPLEIRLSGPTGAYDVKRWKQDWPGCKSEDGVSEGRASIIEASNKKWLRATCRANQIGPSEGGIGWRKPIPPSNRIELAYQVKFSDDFDFVKAGSCQG